ncbi:hypothetical protein LCGC14_2596410, partial [marine sediment metagenome]
GVPDLMHHGVTGYLAESDNAQDLRDGIVKLLEDIPLRNRKSFQFRDVAINEYTLELQAQRYIELYRKIIQSRQ